MAAPTAWPNQTKETMPSKKVAIIHTSFVSVNELKALFGEIIPEASLINIVDDSLLAQVMDEPRSVKSNSLSVCRGPHTRFKREHDLRTSCVVILIVDVRPDSHRHQQDEASLIS
jgi:hypothetical protein